MAHSAYPELGESAIEKLLDALADAAQDPAAHRRRSSAPSTLNIGTIAGRPRAECHSGRGAGRDLDPPGGRSATRQQRRASAVDGLAEAIEVLEFPAVGWAALDGFETTVVAYTTDIPAFGGTWGQPFLFGSGYHSRRAHDRRARAQAATSRSREIYQRIVRNLLQV